MARKAKATEETMIGTVIGGVLNVRAEASRDSKIETVLNCGEEVEIVEKSDEWHKIKDGYVMAEYIEIK